MKISKFFLFLVAAATWTGYAIAQISKGGQPLSRSVNNALIIPQYIPGIELPLPDMDAIRREDSIEMQKPLGQFRIGKLVNTDIDFATSGIITALDNGDKIWRLQIRIPGAPALGLYYDRFHLPEGVQYFLYNGNGRQVLGAYTSDNNTDEEGWANEKVQGDIVNLELNIPANVNLADIYIHINNVAVFYNSVAYLQQYATTAPNARTTKRLPFGGSSVCQINAICDIGTKYPVQRSATVAIEMINGNNVSGCTGTMINNTKQDCTPYLLTASHCAGTGNISNTALSQWMFYFNYETPTCQYSNADQPNTSYSITGATFKARSALTTMDSIAGDFLLLQLKEAPPPEWNIYLAGWDRSGITPVGKTFAFHHPGGDVKKLSTTTTVRPNGSFNEVQKDSHWDLVFETGGIEGGSSGGGLFDSSGRLTGDATAAYIAPGRTCTIPSATFQFANGATYSKLSLNWEYVYQQPSSAATRLKDWLDPENTGVMTLDPIFSTCFPASVTTASVSAGNVTVYPNPSNGVIYANVIFEKPVDLTIAVLSMTGAKLKEVIIPGAITGNYKIDLSNCAAGMYIITVHSGSTVTAKRVTLMK